MRRALINALGQLADSEDEAVVEVGESVLSILREYLRGIPDPGAKGMEISLSADLGGGFPKRKG